MIENIKHWRIGAITAVFLNEDDVMLFGQKEVKTITKALKRSYYTGGQKINMAGEVRVMIDFKPETPLYHSDPNWEKMVCMEVRIQSLEFPNPEKWYHLCNFYPHHLGNLLRNCKFDKDSGEFEGTFSPIISSSADLLDMCSLISESMEEYDEYLEETVREMNCEVNKKTKKWIIGHRYDSPAETRYLLCKTKIRGSAESFPDQPENDVWIYTNNIQGVSSISEALKSKAFGLEPGDLKLMTTIPGGFVELGEVLNDDYSNNFDDYVQDILEHSKKSYFKNIYEEPQNLQNFLIPYLILNSVPEAASTLLKECLREFGYQCLYTLYDKGSMMIWYYGVSGDRRMGTDRSPKENKEALIDLVYYRIPDKNIDKIIYYDTLFQHYGISLDKICDDLVSDWKPQEFMKDLDTYMEHLDYFKSRKQSILTNLDLRKDSLITKDTKETRKLSDLIGNDMLYDTIQKMLMNPENYQERLLGGSKDYMYREANITLSDVLGWARENYGEIPEDLKNEILCHQFCEIHLMYDANKNIE